MKRVSSKSSFPPSVANPASHQPNEITKQQQQQQQLNVKATGAGTSVDSSNELLQLRLENSELLMRLEDALSHTDESKSELLQLLEEQTNQTNLLQSKCDELAAGFVEIDKERRALRKSADDARQDSMHQVERTRAEYQHRCEALEKHIKIREKEVEKLAERTREQERRIEAAVSEWHERQSKVDELEGELEELILLVDKERVGKKTAHEQHIKAVDEMRLNKEGLERKLQDLQHSLHEKEAVLANLQQDQELSRLEHEQALKTMRDVIEAQKAEFEAQQKNMIDLHRNQTSELTNTLQSQIDDKAETIQTITSEMKQLHIIHNQKVAEMESSIREWKENTWEIEKKYQQSCESNEQLQGNLNSTLASYQIAQEEVKATKYLLEKENGELVKELDGTTAQLTVVKEELSNLQMEHTGLQCEYASLEDKHFDLNEKQSTLEAKMERMTKSYEDQISQLSTSHLAMKQELSEEKNLSNNLIMQLRELNIKVSEEISVFQSEKRVLEEELDNLRKLLSMKEKDAVDLQSKYEATISSHLAEMESLKSKHAEEVSVIEMRGADIVSDLEEVISELEKALADKKLESEQVVNRMTLDKECVERSLHDKERMLNEQEGKISSLTAYAKERKEEVRVVKTELVQARQTLESTKREHAETVIAIRNELEESREVHRREMSDLKSIVDEVRLELTMAKERLALDDGELERAKATLSERTNLLRDMVNQTTAYQSDYERERARANTLEEAVSSYKRQLAEARDVGQRLEHEILDKDSHYFDAIRNERQQRKTTESELESSRKALIDLTRKLDEMEKENSEMRSKISRQENYIGRLHDQKRERRFGPVATSGSSKSARPSTAGSKGHAANNRHISSSHIDENKPNLK